jgi:hypothetical protein
MPQASIARTVRKLRAHVVAKMSEMKRKLTREEAAQVESAYTREGDEGVLFLLKGSGPTPTVGMSGNASERVVVPRCGRFGCLGR